MCLEFPELPCLSARENYHDHQAEETCAGFKCLGMITSLALSILSVAGFVQTGDPFFTVLTGVFSVITVCLLAPCCCFARTNNVGVPVFPLPPVIRRRPQLFVDIPEVVSPPVYHVQPDRRVRVGDQSYVPPPVVQPPESHVRVGDHSQPGLPHFPPQQPMHHAPSLQGRVQVGDQRQPGLERECDFERRVQVGKKQ